MSLVGTRVGHIQIVGVLGKGGMGEVYVGHDETLARKVALKAIRGEHRLEPAAKARFLREARILSQLEHKSICRIYDYVEQAGAEFLVLELVEGETLSRAIARGLDRQHALEIAIEIAGVLVAAHAAGVVHRDLKPDNVMIATDGAVKVLDFGLARSGAEEPVPDGSTDVPQPVSTAATVLPDPAATATMADVFHTTHGSIVGTPLYMSPEQARGEPATTASDMYSFGLLLRTLFTGRAPYGQGLDVAAVMRKAKAGELPPLTGVGRDLAALVGRLEALAPAARATAVEALRELEWIRDRPKRHLRRLAAAALLVVAGLGVVKYTLDLRRERTIAVQAREVAVQRGEQAEALISFMLGDVRRKLEPLGKLEILEDVGDKALEYFASVPESELSDREVARRAMALHQIGEVRMKQGQLEGAMEAFAASVAQSEELVRREPDNAEWLETLSLSHFWLGNGHWNQGRFDPALVAFEAYRSLSERLAEIDPSNPARRMEVAYGEFNLGSVLEARGSLDAALEHLEASVEITRALVAESPDRDDWRRELATNHLQTGKLKEALGGLEDALEHYRADVEIMTALVAKDPSHTGWLEQLAIGHNHVGTALERLGRNEAALEHHAAYVDIAQDLVATDPGNQWWRGILAMGQRNLGWLSLAEGEVARGLGLLRTAAEMLGEASRRGSDAATLAARLAIARIGVGQALADRGDLDGALAALEAARAILEPLAAEEASDAKPHRWLAECELLHGEVLRRIGRGDAARAAWQTAHDVILPFARDSRDGTLLAPLARTLLLLGRTEEAREIKERLDLQGFVEPRLRL